MNSRDRGIRNLATNTLGHYSTGKWYRGWEKLSKSYLFLFHITHEFIVYFFRYISSEVVNRPLTVGHEQKAESVKKVSLIDNLLMLITSLKDIASMEGWGEVGLVIASGRYLVKNFFYITAYPYLINNKLFFEFFSRYFTYC